MLVSCNDLEKSDISADVCIVGAGAAGITLAKQLIGSRLSVVVLEAGGLELDTETQELYRGKTEGALYFPLSASRLRYFGGTTGHWGGACLPLDSIDFEKRPGVPHSGWPISRKDLDPYYPLAHEICGIGPFDYRVERWSNEDEAPPLPLIGSELESKIYQNSKPVRFGTEYREELAEAENVTVILNANVTRLMVGSNERQLDHVQAQSLAGKKLTVKSKTFVICAGALESARLLLLSNTQHEKGIGNQNELVGRYFMDHLYNPVGKLLLSDDWDLSLYTRRDVGGTQVRAGLSVSEQTMRDQQLLNSWVGFKLKGSAGGTRHRLRGKAYLINSFEKGEMPEDFWRHVGEAMDDFGFRVKRKLRKIAGLEKVPQKIEGLIGISAHSEQAPNPDSRVYLGDSKDAFGQRQLVMDWRLSDVDHRSIRETINLIAHELGAADIGRVNIEFSERDDVWRTPELVAEHDSPSGSFHQMGTTRMSNDPKNGVVDANLKVHGMDNLYIGSSSVFTTGGFANPTLTIVALSCRLAEHLKELHVS